MARYLRVPKICQKIPLHSNIHLSACILATRVPMVQLKDNGHTYLFYKIHFLTKYVVLALDELKVQIWVLSHFLNDGTQKVLIRIRDK